MSMHFPHLFGRGNAPLYKLTFNNKISHLFGSCHNIPLNRLTFRRFPIAVKQESDEDRYLIDFLKNKKTLITEPGYFHYNKNGYHLDSPDHTKDYIINTRANDVVKRKEIIDLIYEPDICDRFYKLHKFQNELNINKMKIYSRKIYNFNITKFLKNDKVYDILNDVVKLKPYDEIFGSINNISTNYLGNMIYSTVIANGIDSHLTYNYLEDRKHIYSLDRPQDGVIDVNKTFIEKTMIKALYFALIDSKFRKNNNILQSMDSIFDISNKYLYTSWNNTLDCKDRRLLDKRNIKWIPWMIRYHNETPDPLFVVGCGHLNGENGLIKLLQKENFKINIFDTYTKVFI